MTSATSSSKNISARRSASCNTRASNSANPRASCQRNSHKHQLACHFVNQHPLLEPHARVAAQTARPFADIKGVCALVEQMAQLFEDFRDVLHKLAESEQGGEVCASFGVDLGGPRAREGVELLTEE